MNDPRMCIVGAGNLSTRRIYPYIGAAGAQVVGVCDLDRERAERNARRFGGRVYEHLEIMLDKEQPDGVIVCIGPEQHAAMAPFILRKGYPVYTEKPPAVSAAAAWEVARVAREMDLLCVTGFKKRYATAYARARQWIDQFHSNDRYSIAIDYASGQYPNDSALSSFLLDFALHVIDLVTYLFGDVRRVFCFAHGMDAYAVSLDFACGAVGTMNLTCGRSFAVPTEEVEITVRGGNFMTIHNSSSWRIVENEKPVEWREPPTFVSGGDSGNDTGHLAELADFVDAIREGRKTSRSHIRESCKSMLLYEAIKRSAEIGAVVELPSDE